MKMIALAVAATTVVASAAYAAGQMTLDQTIAGSQRSDANKARDQYRHPKQTLEFFGLKPTMTIVEVSPGGGWYTEILAPYVRDKGRYYAVVGLDTAKSEKGIAGFKEKYSAAPYDRTTPLAADALPAGQADMVLTFRNVHNWYMGGTAPQMFAAFYKALKPGGVLGVEEHRLPEGRSDDEMKKSGYMKTSAVVKMAEDAGFKLAAKSEINANPKDKADYPDGVWTLPPTYRLKDVDRARYAAIGESDRMTLKFVKPKK